MSIRHKRIVIIVCIAIGAAAIVVSAALAISGHPGRYAVPAYAVDSIAVVSGLVYRDWNRLHKSLREPIWTHYVQGQTALTCTPEYRDALAAVLAYARRVNAEAEQQAQMQAQAERAQGTLW